MIIDKTQGELTLPQALQRIEKLEKDLEESMRKTYGIMDDLEILKQHLATALAFFNKIQETVQEYYESSGNIVNLDSMVERKKRGSGTRKG